MCDRLAVITTENSGYKLYVWGLAYILIFVLGICYGKDAYNTINMIIMTYLTVCLLSRYCDNENVWYQFDTLTVYFIVWQFTYLICIWEAYDLSWPHLILPQASCCLSMSIKALFMYEVCWHNVSFQYKIAYLWLHSLYDT